MKPTATLFGLHLILVAACGGSADSIPEEAVRSTDNTSAVVTAEERGVVPSAQMSAVVAEAPASRPAAKPAAGKPGAAQQPVASVDPQADPNPSAPVPLALAVGSELAVTTGGEITSRTNRAGEAFLTTVVADVDHADGRTVIPAGAVLTFRILEIKPAENSGGQGTLVLQPVSVRIDGEDYPLKADVTSIQTELKGRGVTGGDAAKVGAGAAAGALIGQILGKKTSSTIIGGVAGAAVGTAVAVKTADRDIVVPPGSRIGLKLSGEFSREIP